MIQLLAEFFAGPYGPILIFFMRILDVSMGTVRMLLLVQGRKSAVAALGVVEVSVWLMAAGTAIQNLTSGWHILGYACGFGAGNWVGLWIEERLAFGHATIRIVAKHTGVEAFDALRERGFGVTEFAGVGGDGGVEVGLSVIRRKHLREALAIIDQWAPDAFVTVEMPRSIRRGYLGQMKRL